MKQDTKPNSIERLTASVSEAAQMLGVSARTVFQLTKNGKIPHKRLGNRIVYSIEALKRFINEPDTQE